MADTLHPRDAKDVEAAVQWALAQKKSLEIVGHGTKRAPAGPPRSMPRRSLGSSASPHEPEELAFGARRHAVAEIEACSTPAPSNSPSSRWTMVRCRHAAATGDDRRVLAANLSGPRRIKRRGARLLPRLHGGVGARRRSSRADAW
jgi:glycolate oxidase FAD binding subunit